MIRQFIRGVKNLIRWFPIIWNDRQFDFIYLLLILRKKLFLMSKMKSCSVGYPKEQKKMQIAALLIDRIIKDDYINATNYVEDFCVDKDGYFHAKCVKNPVVFPMTFSDAVKHEIYMKNQDVDLLCKILNRHLLCWWE